MLFSLQTMCTCTFYGLARSMYVRGVAYVCGVANVFVFGGVRYLKCDSCQYFAGMLIHFRFGENFGIKHSFWSYFYGKSCQIFSWF